MHKRLLALLLAAALGLSLLTGCTGGQQQQTEEEDPDAPLVLTDEIRSDPVAYVTDGAMHMADTVLDVDGAEVSAGAFFYLLAYQYYQASSMYENYGVELDLSQPVSEDGPTLAEYMVDAALEEAKHNRVLKAQAETLGLELGEALEAQLQQLQGYLTDQIALFYVTNVDSMMEVNRNSLFASRISEYYYGDSGVEAPTDDTLTDYAQQHGHYTCRYILLRTDDLAEDDTAGKTAQQAKAQALYDQMSGMAGEELLTTFAALQAEHNADGNTEPFSFDEDSSLVSGFREKVSELAPGEIGLTDETAYGYFVVLRLEPDLSEVREQYVSERYEALVTQWVEACTLTEGSALADMDALTVLNRLGKLQAAVMEEMNAEAEEDTAGTEDTAETAEDTADTAEDAAETGETP